MRDKPNKLWEKFCALSDKAVQSFKDERGCPFCGGEGFARWNYEVIYYPYFIIECDTCGCRIRSDISFDDAVEKWNRRKGE